MKLIELTMTAFGPFCQKETIRFEPFSGHVFLIRGETGAGKTTILDAIVFALYGDTSSGTREAGLMRNLSADAKLATEVSLTFEIQGERWRITRRPHCLRAKKRGTGLVVESETCELVRLTENRPVPGKEISDKIASLIGFDKTQFRMVMVLPQGQFRKFLECGTKERAEVLEHIFEDASLYGRISQILSEQHSSARAEHDREFELLAQRRTAAARLLECETVPASASGLEQLLTEKKAAFSRLEAELAEATNRHKTAQESLNAIHLANEKVSSVRKSTEALESWEASHLEALGTLDRSLERHRLSIPVAAAHDSWTKDQKRSDGTEEELSKATQAFSAASLALNAARKAAPADADRNRCQAAMDRARSLGERSVRIAGARKELRIRNERIRQLQTSARTLEGTLKALAEQAAGLERQAARLGELADKAHQEETALGRLTEAQKALQDQAQRTKDLEEAAARCDQSNAALKVCQEACAKAGEERTSAEPAIRCQIENAGKRRDLCGNAIRQAAQCSEDAREIHRLDGLLKTRQRERDAAAAKLQAARDAVQKTSQLAGDRDRAKGRLDAVQKVLRGLELIAGQQKSLALANEKVAGKEAAAKQAQRRWMDSAAVLIAQNLAEGTPCPVCGNVHFVRLAHGSAGLSETAETLFRQTQAELVQAQKEATKISATIQTWTDHLNSRVQEAGLDDPQKAQALWEELSAKITALEAGIASLHCSSDKELAALEEASSRADQAFSSVSGDHATQLGAAKAHSEELRQTQEKLAAGPQTDLQALAEELAGQIGQLNAKLAALIEAADAAAQKASQSKLAAATAVTKKEAAAKAHQETLEQSRRRLQAAGLSDATSLETLAGLLALSQKQSAQTAHELAQARAASDSLVRLREDQAQKGKNLEDTHADIRQTAGGIAQIEDSLADDLAAFPAELRSPEAIEAFCLKAQAEANELSASIASRDRALADAKAAAAGAEAALGQARQAAQQSAGEAAASRAALNAKVEELGVPLEEILGWGLGERLPEASRQHKELTQAHAELTALKKKAELEAAGLSWTDPAPLEAAIAELAGQEQALAERHGAAKSALKAGSEAVRECRHDEDVLGAAFERIASLERLSSTCAGRSNQQMSLERFVLASLFDEVLEAGNQRLRELSRGRYAMQRPDSDEPRLGRVHDTSLEIDVWDLYYGKARPASTLSGGEGFLTSLALALGLADVIGSRQGGASLETFFIDEGFGTLDEDSCAKVAQVLAGISACGRTVGIISHVAQLSEAISMNLTVKKNPHGNSHCETAFGN